VIARVWCVLVLVCVYMFAFFCLSSFPTPSPRSLPSFQCAAARAHAQHCRRLGECVCVCLCLIFTLFGPICIALVDSPFFLTRPSPPPPLFRRFCGKRSSAATRLPSCFTCHIAAHRHAPCSWESFTSDFGPKDGVGTREFWAEYARLVAAACVCLLLLLLLVVCACNTLPAAS